MQNRFAAAAEAFWYTTAIYSVEPPIPIPPISDEDRDGLDMVSLRRNRVNEATTAKTGNVKASSK
jgi:hypothetical protein